MLYLEDLHDGRQFQLGSVQITKDSMLSFAKDFDPQVFHLDEAVSKKLFGGLIASGWHTASLCHRLIVDGFLGKAACMASPGVDELKFLQPVFAEDILTGSIVVEASRVSKTKPDRGMVKLRVEMQRENGTKVLSMLGNVIIGCRP